MRRLLILGLLGLLGWWALSRRRGPDGRIVVGYEDGSAVDVPPGTDTWERIRAHAAEALRP